LTALPVHVESVGDASSGTVVEEGGADADADDCRGACLGEIDRRCASDADGGDS